MPRASIVRPGKREIPSAGIATTWPGASGGSEAVGTASSTMLAGVILVINRQDAGLRPGANISKKRLQSRPPFVVSSDQALADASALSIAARRGDRMEAVVAEYMRREARRLE